VAHRCRANRCAAPVQTHSPVRTYPSPLHTTSSAFQDVSRSTRRVLLRVVNLAGAALGDSSRDLVRSPDYDDEGYGVGKGEVGGRGRLGDVGVFWGAESSLAFIVSFFGTSVSLPSLSPPSFQSLFSIPKLTDIYLGGGTFFVRWTILVLIVINAVVLTIQASPTLTLASANASPQAVRTYFHTWEDYALFALFVFFTYVDPRSHMYFLSFAYFLFHRTDWKHSLDYAYPSSSTRRYRPPPFIWPFSMTDLHLRCYYHLHILFFQHDYEHGHEWLRFRFASGFSSAWANGNTEAAPGASSASDCA